LELLTDVGSFGIKALIIVISIVIVLVTFMALALKNKLQGQIEAENLNEKLDEEAEQLRSLAFEKNELKDFHKKIKKDKKAKKTEDLPRVFVLNFKGDMKASSLDLFRDEITLVLNTAAPNKDEVLLKLESPGGMVHSYGLAAAQMLRIKEHKLRLTVCIDKVAASGGYLMACTADHIISAPFAILGSIGVIAQVPNFNRLLKKHDIDYQEITAGEYKRTISLMGEITEKGKEKFTEEINDTHLLFKEFVSRHRPQLDLSKVATGEHWFGERAIKLNLADAIGTSDEEILKLKGSKKLIRVTKKPKKSFSQKFTETMSLTLSLAFDRSFDKWLEKNNKINY